MSRLPTPEQRRLDADFAAIFGLPTLPAIEPPLSPEQVAEGNECAERC